MTYIGPEGAARVLNGYHRPAWDAVTMVAIAGAESTWRTDAISPTNDYGVWQINSQAWPELFRNYRWYDPVDNAAMMNHVYNVQGVHAWSTYNQGLHLRFMAQARAAVEAVFGQTYTGGGSAPPGGGGGAVDIDLAAGVNQVSGQLNSLAQEQAHWADVISKLW